MAFTSFLKHIEFWGSALFLGLFYYIAKHTCIQHKSLIFGIVVQRFTAYPVALKDLTNTLTAHKILLHKVENTIVGFPRYLEN